MPPRKSAGNDECVKVCVRCRPMERKEQDAGHERVVDMDLKRSLVSVRNPRERGHGDPPKEFTFDAIYDWNSRQMDLYEETFRPLVESVLQGFNGTIFAYGQTGTGKTFTMEGIRSNKEQRGVIPNSFEHIFSHIARSTDQQYFVRAQYLEIYKEEIKDLLSKNYEMRLELKEKPGTGVYVKDLSSFIAKDITELDHVMNVGNKNRSVGATNMNEHSSRSHAIFIITIECAQAGDDGKDHIRVGKLNLVDLAGSERQAKTGSTGTRLEEAVKINLSLSALGNVISTLVDGKSTHIPYRDAKLTRLLQDSLGGNSKTVMVATIGPASYNYEETLTTLRYANRAKNIKNKPKINEDPKDTMIRQFQEEIAKLRSMLDGGPGGGGVAGGKKGRKGKRRRVDENGDEIEDDADEIEEFMKQQQAKLEEEKSKIMNDHSLISEEKQRLLKEMRRKEKELEKEQESQVALVHHIKMMESKLLIGGKTIVDHANEQERRLEERRALIAEEKNRERDMQLKLEQQEEENIGTNQQFANLQQEVDFKTKKLKKYFAKFQALKQEIKDLTDANDKERMEMENTQTELQRDLKLRQLILENFVPKDEREKLANRVYWDPEENEWKAKAITKDNTKSEQELQMAKRPISAYGLNRAMTTYARNLSSTCNPRYLGENVLFLELDMPNRTTRDYESPTLAPHLQAALDTALRDEEDIEVEDTRPTKKKSNKKKPAKLQKQPQRAARGKDDFDDDLIDYDAYDYN